MSESKKTDCGMNVFISWSGERGQHVARTLRKWIPYVLQAVDPWMSHEDIEPGTRWATELANKLECVNFGVICLTPETLNTPWVLFEAGALAKALDDAVVCPYLIDLEPGDLKGPLNQFNAVLSNQDGSLGLFRSMNKALPGKRRLSDIILEETFERWWPSIKADLSQGPTAPGAHSVPLTDSGLGLEYISGSRAPALEIFAQYLEAEIGRGADGVISMVGTSMRGFLVHKSGEFDGGDLLRRAAQSNVHLRLLLVNPSCGDLRADFEERPKGTIPAEIRSDVGDLHGLGIKQECVRYYDAGPTVYGIATSDRMLLNPYPSSMEAHAGFTLIVRKTQQRTDIYQQYEAGHFNKLWDKHSSQVPDEDWQAKAQPDDLRGDGKRKDGKKRQGTRRK